MKKLLTLISLCLLSVACRTNDESTVTVTPPVVEAVATTVPADTPTTAAPLPTNTQVPEPDQPTAPSTAVSDEPPTATPTEIPATDPPPTDIPAQPVSSIQLVPIIRNGLTSPVYLTHAFDDRLFVVEQAGQIRIIENGLLLEEPFIDIRNRVGSSANEQGLLSVAFHPDYQQNGRFFVNYTNTGGHTIVAQYLVRADNPNQADPDSETILLTVNQPFPNHNGGQLQFGPGGYLYIGMGDGGSGGDPQNHGQNPNTLLGAILRLDVNVTDDPYGIPATNPFVDDDGRRNEIWAYGLRNPWRFSFDRLTGDLYIADVGQNIWEEVNFQPASSNGGENYGWNIMEGLHCFRSSSCDTAGLELPIFEYNHDQGCSITGGYVYRGRQFPSLTGNYIVADFCNGTIWSLSPQADGSWLFNTIFQSDGQITSFGEDMNGELYVLIRSGQVHQIQP